MSNEHANRPLARILLILELLQSLQEKNPDQETFVVSLDDFTNYHVLLSDLNSLEIAFQNITKGTDSAISIQFDLKPEMHPSATSTENQTGRSSIVGVIVHIDDPRELQRYKIKIQNQIDNEKSWTQFSFKKYEGAIVISVVGGTGEECKFSRGIRRKLLELLATEKRFLTVQDIKNKLKIDPVQIRRSVDDIRDKVSKALKVPRDQIIANNPETDEGYGFLNIEVKS